MGPLTRDGSPGPSSSANVRHSEEKSMRRSFTTSPQDLQTAFPSFQSSKMSQLPHSVHSSGTERSRHGARLKTGCDEHEAPRSYVVGCSMGTRRNLARFPQGAVGGAQLFGWLFVGDV